MISKFIQRNNPPFIHDSTLNPSLKYLTMYDIIFSQRPNKKDMCELKKKRSKPFLTVTALPGGNIYLHRLIWIPEQLFSIILKSHCCKHLV